VPIKRLLSDPRFYGAWPVFVIACLYAAYVADPHIFGLAVLALGAATGLMSIIGTFFVVMRQGASRSTRLTVTASLFLSVVAILSALAILGSFKWA
jgi:nitrate reductase gamma subunit